MKNKNSFCIFPLMAFGFILFLTSSCKDDSSESVPKLTTTAISAIAGSTATSGGEITEDGGSDILTRGVCWDTAAKPTISKNKTENGVGTGIFTSHITGLSANTTYHVRAYATNDTGPGYGDELTFTTSNTIPIPCTPPQNSIVYNLQTEHYYTYAGEGAGVWGNYGIAGNGSSSTLFIDFIQAPVTGEYTTIGATSFIGPKECIVHGTFGSMIGYNYYSNTGGTVYVLKNGTDEYSMTFCGLHFTSGSTSYTFDSDGNLTSQ